ncbi:MAG: VWA domain-containing protein [Vicinamibacterales bacterium]
MTRALVPAVAVALAAALMTAGPSAAPQASGSGPAQGQAQTPSQSIFRASIEGVSVSVSVRKGGQAVQDLTAADFQLEDNGVAQRIQAVSVETLPIDVTLMLDVSASVEGRRLERLKRSVTETAQYIRPDDQFRLIAVQHSLQQIFGFQPGGTVPAVDALQARGGTSLLDGLAATLMRAAEPERRQLIISYTDGQDTISILDRESVANVAGFADAVLYFVVPTSGARNRTTSTAATLADLAVRTGGEVFWVDYDAPISDAFQRALEAFRKSYVLRYTPAGVKEGGWHEVTVRVPKDPTYEIRARRGYGG